MSQLEDEIEEVDYSLKVNNQLLRVYKWSMESFGTPQKTEPLFYFVDMGEEE